MTKFIAKQPTSNVVLQGVSVLWTRSGVTFDIDDNRIVAETTTIRLEVEGHDFKGSFGTPKLEGTVTGLEYSTSGTLIYKITGAKIDYSEIYDKNDAAKVTAAIFAKDDILKGSFSSDILEGFRGNDKFDGKEGTDTLYGDGGRDSLSGGAGYDTLDGGKGKDTYVFKSDPTTTGYDTIVKFEKGEHFELKAKYFPGLAVGEFADGQFVTGPNALDADDRIIYDPATGFLSYDPDGAGGTTAPIIFAKVQPNIDYLSADNFLVI